MIIRLDLKKVGNHWYPCLDHFDPNQISLDPMLEALLSTINERDMGLDNVCVYFKSIDFDNGEKHVLKFNRPDIERYFTTDEDFEINAYIDDYHFYVSSDLYMLMEKTYKLDLHKNLYKLEIW